MDQTLPPEDDVPNGPLIDAGAGFAMGLVRRLRAQLAHPPAAFGAAFLRRLVRQFLLPAEAALRRALYLIADTLAPEPARAPLRPASAPARPAGARPPAPPRTPGFRLTETPPRAPVRRLPPNAGPRISIAGLAPSPPPPRPRRPVDPVALEDRLHRRLAAFDAAFTDPLRAARRLLRLLARRASPRPVLSLVRVPGLDAKPLDPAERRLLADLNTAVIAAFARVPNTS
jgi:hypothetical protein